MRKPTLKVGDVVYDGNYSSAKVVKIEQGQVTLDVNPKLPIPTYAVVWAPPRGWLFVGMS